MYIQHHVYFARYLTTSFAFCLQFLDRARSSHAWRGLGLLPFKHLILGPPKMNRGLLDERNLVFAIAQCEHRVDYCIHFYNRPVS